MNLMKSYVWHDGKCYFVSTINRESSTVPPMEFAETLVWDYDYHKITRGKMVGQGEDGKNMIGTHLLICEKLFETGKCDIDEE